MFFQKLLKVCFIIWLVLWVVFFIRENKDGEYKDFFNLFGKSLEEKRAYLLGEDFYNFLNACKDNVPSKATYKLAGLGPFAIDEVRGIYYLAPLKAVEENYDYIFVYGSGDFTEEGFDEVFEFNKNSYILKRI